MFEAPRDLQVFISPSINTIRRAAGAAVKKETEACAHSSFVTISIILYACACDTFPVRDMESPVIVDKPPEYHGKADNNNRQVSS